MRFVRRARDCPPYPFQTGSEEASAIRESSDPNDIIMNKNLLAWIIPYLGLALGQATSAEAASDDADSWPRATLSNGPVRMDLCLPDPENGYYRGTRFDWSGVVMRLSWNGHEFFGEWQDSDDPTLHDRISGPVESFQNGDSALGYREARVGEGFVKIGIGVLEKPAEPSYRWAHTYRLMDSGKWRVERDQTSITFRHTLNGPRGIAYVYTKRIALTLEPPGFVIDHTLHNTGTAVIETDQYNHNFFVIDGRPSGPEFVIGFPFAPRATHDLQGLMRPEGRQLRYLTELGKQSVFTGVEGFGASIDDHRVTVHNRKTGAGVKFSVDRPLHKMNFWSIRTTVCPENYIFLRIPPGSREQWVSSYELFTSVGSK